MQIVGQLAPANHDWGIPNIRVDYKEASKQASISISFIGAYFKITISSDIDDIEWQLARAIEVFENYVAARCLFTAWRPQIVFQKTIIPDRNLLFGDAHLRSLIGTADNAGDLTDALIEACMEDIDLGFAIRDLSYAIIHLNSCEIFAFHAVETIRNNISPTGQKAERWERLRETLKISREYLDLLTSASEPARHGRRREASGEVSREVMRRAWTIVARFAQYVRARSANEAPPQFESL